MSGSLSSLAETLVEFLVVESVYAVVVFAIVLVLSRVVGRRSPRFQYWIWSLVFVRLALPIDLSHQWSLRSLISSWSGSTDPVSPLSGKIGGLETTVSHVVATTVATGNGAVNWVAMALAGLWLTSVTLLLVKRIAATRRVARILADARCLTDDARLEALESWRQRLGIRRQVKLFVGRDPVTPFTTGIIRPVVYVPRAVTEHRDASVLDAVLGHELAHVARWDWLWMGLQRTLETVFFFNPVVRLSGARVDDERERLCDLIAADRGDLAPHRYAGGLLSVLRLDLQGVGAPTMAAKKGRVHMRITEILEERSRRADKRFPAVLVALVVGAFILPLSNSGAETSIPAAPSTIQTEESRPDLHHPLPAGRLTSSYGEAINPFSGKLAFHKGVDIAASEGTPIMAPADGLVRVATTEFDEVVGAGTVVIIDHEGGWETRFYHLSELHVAAGERVKAGEIVGGVGNTGKSTGAHLHLEVRHLGALLDPAEFVEGLGRK